MKWIAYFIGKLTIHTHAHTHAQILHKCISLSRRMSLAFGVRHAYIQIPVHHSTILGKSFVSSLLLSFTPSSPLSISPLIPLSFLLFFLPFWITEQKNLSGTPSWEPGLTGEPKSEWKVSRRVKTLGTHRKTEQYVHWRE